MALSGCTGTIEPLPQRPSGSDGSHPPRGSWQCTEPRPGPSPLRRLSHREYRNTIRDLLGPGEVDAMDFAPDPTVHGFDNEAVSLVVSPLLVEQYMAAAEGLAAAARGDVASDAGCDLAGADGECVRRLVADFGRRAFRRPLTDAEVSTYAAVYETGRLDGGPAAGVELVLTRMLQSPHFLYRVELGEAGPDGRSRPTGYEMAARLSYGLWGTMPDEELFAAAAAGALRDPAEVDAQARRMLEDPRADEMVAAFHTQWLGLDEVDDLDKDERVYPSTDPALFASMRRETELFLQDAFWSGPGFRERLFTGNFTYVDERLAAHYGVDGPSGDGFERVALDGVERTGLLTQGGLLSLLAKPYESSPVSRGAFVRRVLLCQELPDPPANVDITPPEVDPTRTTRERFEQHRSDPVCASCHRLLDPIGFGFESYDGVGAYRDSEHGLPIDDSGELEGTDVDGPFVGAVGLSQRLADSRDVSACLALSWFRFVYGREPTPDDACTLERLETTLEETDNDMTALLLEMTQTEAFLAMEGGAR
jgi:hypothetical protein